MQVCYIHQKIFQLTKKVLTQPVLIHQKLTNQVQFPLLFLSIRQHNQILLLTFRPSPTPIPDNSRELQKAINALGKTGGEIVLQSDQYLSEIDVSVTSNVVLSGADSNVTLHLMSKRLNAAINATNVVIKNLSIDASFLGDRNVLAIYAGSKNVTLTDLVVQNHFSNKSAIISLGSNVTLSNLAFVNVSEAYPMQIAGSYSNVRNCSSNDQATYALVTIGAQFLM
jgi:hypothetical protein